MHVATAKAHCTAVQTVTTLAKWEPLPCILSAGAVGADDASCIM